ncbi:MAG: peptidoglycan DD-metalloendopeptidase family protein [Euzebyales bacterium]|nr:peptidoglycan DD-metalloendopeptidase family protein [Euzebyales bacterium]
MLSADRARRLLTGLCILAMLLPATAVLAAEDPENDLEEVEQRIEDARERVEEVDGERTVTIADLERIDAQLGILDGKLAELQSELAVAEAELGDAERRVAATTAELTRTEGERNATQQALAGEREQFTRRTRATYMYGGTDPTIVALSTRSVADFTRAMEYVQRIVEVDRDRVNQVSGLVRQVEAATDELEALRAKQTAQQQAAEAQRDDVAGLVAEEEEVRAVVAAERQKRQLVLNQLDSDRATHLAMISSLEEESDKLTEEIRRIEEERRLGEERRQQEEEARRVAAAQEQEQEQGQEQEQEQEREQAAASRSSSGGGGGGGRGGGGSPPPEEAPASTGRMQRPADGPITSRYGYRVHPIFGTRRLHAGIDFGGGYGAPIYAAESGTVISAGSRGGYGNTIVVDHGGGTTTLYAHQSRFAVSGGAQVGRGQVIGYIGSTGYSTGPHLHFEVRINGAPTDPAPYL